MEGKEEEGEMRRLSIGESLSLKFCYKCGFCQIASTLPSLNGAGRWGLVGESPPA